MASYEELITGDRARQSSSPKKLISDESHSDRARLIFSSPFRRLQRKAQVFPLESFTAVRTRLTHSVEVSTIGKYIAQKIIHNLCEKGDLEAFKLNEYRDVAFVNIVETACLMHDIGNPPFGHFGEYAISDWFSKYGMRAVYRSLGNRISIGAISKIEVEEFEKKQFLDFTKFDGNAQGLRVVTKLQGKSGQSGLNLTYSQLAAYIKYVNPPYELDSGNKDEFKNKPGYFCTELEVVHKIWHNLRMIKNKRHPLVYIMEAADDIAYCLSDIEDGVEKRIIDEDYLSERIIKQIDSYCEKNSKSDACYTFCRNLVEESFAKKDNLPIDAFIKFKTSLINHIVKTVADIYISNHNEIMAGNSVPLIKRNDECYTMLKTLKNFSINSIFQTREAEDIELGGYSVIFGLLNRLSRLLECPREDFEAIRNNKTKAPNIGSTDLERRLYNLLPDRYIGEYDICCSKDNNDIFEWYYRAHLITDYISAMTDDYALKTYQLLSGIKVT